MCLICASDLLAYKSINPINVAQKDVAVVRAAIQKQVHIFVAQVLGAKKLVVSNILRTFLMKCLNRSKQHWRMTV